MSRDGSNNSEAEDESVREADVTTAAGGLRRPLTSSVMAGVDRGLRLQNSELSKSLAQLVSSPVMAGVGEAFRLQNAEYAQPEAVHPVASRQRIASTCAAPRFIGPV
jgi:hypothetical protein